MQEKQPQRENPLKAAEQTTEQNYNMIDGRINNTPTVDELEAKVKSGETISLVDLANAVKADKQRARRRSRKRSPLSGRSSKPIRNRRRRRNPQSRSHRTWKGADPLKKLNRFEQVDIIASLDAIMRQNTAFFQSDFDIDKEILREAAARSAAEDKQLLWLSRPSGTYCFRERDVFLKDTRQHNTWKYYGEQTNDTVLAYAVELTGKENGKLMGNLYELDYPQHFRRVAEKSVPADNYTLIYEHGERTQPAGAYFDGNPDPQLGKFERFEAQPNDPEALRQVLREERKSRETLTPGDMKAHIDALHDSRIEREARRVAEKMKSLREPNSPEKTHFMVELSPDFVRLATTRTLTACFPCCPTRPFAFPKIGDRHGTFALVGKAEDRSKGIRKPRPSVGRSLPQTKGKPPRKRRQQSQNNTKWRYEHEPIYR